MAKKSRIAKRTLRFRLTWDDEVEEWPAHDGEADPFNAGPGDPRPVC